MRRRFQFALLLSLLYLTGTVIAESRIDCDALKSRILKDTVHYCVLLPASYDANATKNARLFSVLYFLHGLGDNEQSLIRIGALQIVNELRSQHKIGDFLMVAPEGKRSFFINSADNSYRYNDFFIREFLPHIESKYRVRHDRGGRAITGMSMGGYGALRFAFAYPAMFSSVSAESAALITDTPAEINAGIQSGIPMLRVLGNVFGNPINAVHWRQNSPLEVAKLNEVGVKTLAISFNCGRDDEYGFARGAEALHKQLLAEGAKHEFHIYPGGHTLGYFVAHLPELLEFHSRAFERR
jgi:S-formylglutathione hydrolase FrmB